MKTIDISEANALQAYNRADEKGKLLLSDLLGKEIFNRDITDRVNSFLEACNITGESPELPHKGLILTKIQLRANFTYQIEVICKALNEGWEPDMLDKNERKWYPWMILNDAASAFRFGGSVCDFSGAFAGSGVRLKNEKVSNHLGKKFEKLLSDHLLTFQK